MGKIVEQKVFVELNETELLRMQLFETRLVNLRQSIEKQKQIINLLPLAVQQVEAEYNQWKGKSGIPTGILVEFDGVKTLTWVENVPDPNVPDPNPTSD